jgi:replicative DNA helicase
VTDSPGPDSDFHGLSSDSIDSIQDMFAYDDSFDSSPPSMDDHTDVTISTRPQRTTDIGNVLGFADLRDQVYKEILDPESSRGVLSQDLPALNRIMKGHRLGELTIVTGPTGGGKTTVMSQLSLDYCKSGVPTLWGSFEILNQRLAKKMLYQYAEKDLSTCPEELPKWADKFQEVTTALCYKGG